MRVLVLLSAWLSAGLLTVFMGAAPGVASDLPEEPQEGDKFHAATRSIDQFYGVQFMTVNEVAPQVIVITTPIDALNDDICFFGEAG